MKNRWKENRKEFEGKNREYQEASEEYHAEYHWENTGKIESIRESIITPDLMREGYRGVYMCFLLGET